MAHPTAWLQRQERFLPNLSKNVQTKLHIMLDVTQHRGEHRFHTEDTRVSNEAQGIVVLLVPWAKVSDCRMTGIVQYLVLCNDKNCCWSEICVPYIFATGWLLTQHQQVSMSNWSLKRPR